MNTFFRLVNPALDRNMSIFKIAVFVAPPSSVVKCLWEVFVWGFLLVVRVCVPVSGVFSLSVCPVWVWPVDRFTKQAQYE